jgi:hypothetical protein
MNINLFINFKKMLISAFKKTLSFGNKFHKFQTYKIINYTKFKFCQKINNSDFETDLNLLTNFDSFNNFYSNYENILENDIEKKLYFLDYYSTFIEQEQNLKKFELKEDIYKNLADKIYMTLRLAEVKTLNNIYILSLIESLNKMNYYGNTVGKLWITLEYIILRTDFLKNIPITNYSIILKAFQPFFMFKDTTTTISAEEVFEAVEYQIILRLKSIKEIDIENLQKYIEIYILFGKNMEGSVELYSKLINNLFSAKNLDNLITIYPELFISMYFSSVLIKIYVITRKNKIFDNFLNTLEEILTTKFRDKTIDFKNINLNIEKNSNIGDMLNFCFNKRNIKI